MKKETIIPPKVGDILTVDFIKNQNGGRPICRINGMVYFIDKAVTKSLVVPMSSWLVEIESIHERSGTVTPIERVRTVKDNEILMQVKLAALVPPKKERAKIVKTYQYRSFAELQSFKNETSDIH